MSPPSPSTDPALGRALTEIALADPARAREALADPRLRAALLAPGAPTALLQAALYQVSVEVIALCCEALPAGCGKALSPINLFEGGSAPHPAFEALVARAWSERLRQRMALGQGAHETPKLPASQRAFWERASAALLRVGASFEGTHPDPSPANDAVTFEALPILDAFAKSRPKGAPLLPAPLDEHANTPAHCLNGGPAALVARLGALYGDAIFSAPNRIGQIPLFRALAHQRDGDEFAVLLALIKITPARHFAFEPVAESLAGLTRGRAGSACAPQLRECARALCQKHLATLPRASAARKQEILTQFAQRCMEAGNQDSAIGVIEVGLDTAGGPIPWLALACAHAMRELAQRLLQAGPRWDMHLALEAGSGSPKTMSLLLPLAQPLDFERAAARSNLSGPEEFLLAIEGACLRQIHEGPKRASFQSLIERAMIGLELSGPKPSALTRRI